MDKVQDRNMSPSEIAQSWAGLFRFNKESNGNPGLRSPQIGALHALMAHAEDGESSALVVMPTGTGKTETMLAFMVANICHKVLVIVPSDALRKQTYQKFQSLGLLRQLKAVPEDINLPIVSAVSSELTDENWRRIINSSNVIVTTMTLATKVSRIIQDELKSQISHIFIDEAHHSKATTWNSFISMFPPNRVILFTATPFRNDGQRLPGKVVFNFSLKKAQEQGYYKDIRYYPILEYCTYDADIAIANKATSILKSDLEEGYDHIVMARCKSKKRAEEVLQVYNEICPEHSPIVIHSGMKNPHTVLNAILERKHRIVVCVNMLGEGYDLPQLKIAAIHDEKQSLPVTLQFIGRFTRTGKDNLGRASFITNIAYPPIAEEVNSLYQMDADWNHILPRINEEAASQKQKLSEFLSTFKGDLNAEISLEDIRPVLSAELYTTISATPLFSNWSAGIQSIAKYDYTLSSISEDTLVVVLGKSTSVKWGDTQTLSNLNWDIIVVYFEAEYRRLFLNSSIKLSGESFLSAIVEAPQKLQDERVYRVFANIDRLRLFNVGARLQSQDISFQSYYGKSVQDGLDLLTQGKLLKNNLFGVGFKKGDKTSIGCSIKGRVWSRERADLLHFQRWCREIGKTIFNEAIDYNVVLENTLRLETLSSFPSVCPISIDWNPRMYEFYSQPVMAGSTSKQFDNLEMQVDTEASSEKSLIFLLKDEEYRAQLEIQIDQPYNCLMVTQISGEPLRFIRGDEELSPNDFFKLYPPTVFYADNSISYGVQLCQPKNQAEEIPAELITTMSWDNVDLSKESQGVFPHVADSIQYYIIQKIKDLYSILIDDDGSGEIADLVGVNSTSTTIDVTLYHLKFARNGCISKSIENLYQVCGQAQKCIRWKYQNGRKLFDHILRRNARRVKSKKSSRIIKGNEEDIMKLREEASNKKEVRYHVVIVQPGMSKSDSSPEMRLLLGTTVQVLRQMANIDCHLICSE